MSTVFISPLLTPWSGDRVSLNTEEVKEQDWTTDKRKQLRKYNHLLAQTLIIFVNTFGGQGVTNIDNNEDNEDNDGF